MSKSAQAQFARYVIKLRARLQTLQKQISDGDTSAAEEEVNTCRAMLQTLYDYAVQHDVDMNQFIAHLSDIESQLLDIKIQIERQKRPWWRNILTVVIRTLAIVADLVGLGSFVRALEGRDRPRLPPP